MGVVNGQAVSAEITNPAFLDATEDDTASGKITLANADAVSGTAITNIQREHNSAAAFMGKAVNTAKDSLPSWPSSQVGTGTDTLRDRSIALSDEFHNATGHNHDGTAGNGAPISAAAISSVPYRGFVIQGTDLLGVTGSSTVVTSQFTGKTPGGSDTALGVVTAAPWNKLVLRQASGSNEGDAISDALGNTVYGRITESGGVWTISYFVDIGGVETVYSFGSATDVRFYYQEIFNPLAPGVPTYSEFAVIPSDNVTAGVTEATTTVKGKVQLATAVTSVGSANSAGTANATVANSDHTHRGLASLTAANNTLYGDIALAVSGMLTAQLSAPNEITIGGPNRSDAAPNSVGSANQSGTGFNVSRADHTHRGVSSLNKSGDAAIYGAVTLTASGGVTLTQLAQDIAIDAPALASSAPNDITTANQVGVGTTAARADHSHKGVRSFSASSQPQLFGDVVLAAGSNVILGQVGNTITITAAGGGGGGGGGSTVWFAPGLYAPLELEENNQNVYLFPPGGDARLVIFLRIPQDYLSGIQAFCLLSAYSPSAANNFLLRTTTYLIRNGIDAISSTANSYTSTNVALTNTVSNMLRSVSMDLTDGTGQINAIVPSPGDILRIELSRATDTDTADVRVIPSATQLKLT